MDSDFIVVGRHYHYPVLTELSTLMVALEEHVDKDPNCLQDNEWYTYNVKKELLKHYFEEDDGSETVDFEKHVSIEDLKNGNF